LTDVEHMFDTGDMTAPDWTPGPPRGSQQILNSEWPKYPENFVERRPIPVWVLIEWDRDGEQWCPGETDRWNHWFVRVQLDNEPRAIQRLTWVKPHDVRRRNPNDTGCGTEPARGEAEVPGS
jgi:hypothetical protein